MPETPETPETYDAPGRTSAERGFCCGIPCLSPRPCYSALMSGRVVSDCWLWLPLLPMTHGV
jgi:hypothetical protein